MEFNLEKEKASIIKVIGVGGGGSNAVNHMYKQGIKGVDFLICNTDQQALDLSPIPNKIQLGSSLTQGRGAGSKPEVGENAAIESIDEIKEILECNTQMVFITAGMGGGTGTGAAPVIAEAAREMDILTVGIVTIPFAFEGNRRKKQAEAGLKEMRESVDTLLVISNDRLREMHGNLKISEAFSMADDILTVAAKGIAEIITVAGYINVDFEDVKTVMKEGGTAIMGSASAEGEGRAVKAVSHALTSPLLNDNDITGANYILLNITSGDEEVTMDEIDEITEYIQSEAGNSADIIWGNGVDEELGNKISVTIIATGFGTQETSNTESLTKKQVVKLDDDVDTTVTQKVPDPSYNTSSSLEPELKIVNAPENKEIDFSIENSKVQEEGVKRYNLEDIVDEDGPKETPSDKIIKKEVKEKLSQKPTSDEINKIDNEISEKKIHEEKLRKRMQALGEITSRLRKPGGLNELEREPAYKRRQINLDDVPHSSESTVSRFSLSQDENKNTTLRQNNSFLHDNVD